MKIKQVFKLYDVYNKEFFKGKLPFVDIRFAKFEEYGWMLESTDGVPEIEIADNLSDQEIHDTLLHEMVHVWQFVNKLKVNHGKRFKKKARYICARTGISEL